LVVTHWQNGPDVYQGGDSAGFEKVMLYPVICRVVERGTQFPKKSDGDAAREPFDVAALRVSLDEEEKLSLWHAIQFMRHGAVCDQRFFDMIASEPEKAEDICVYYAMRSPHFMLDY